MTVGFQTTSTWLAYIGDYNFLDASGWLFAISIVVIVTASLLTPPPREDQIKGLTYASVRESGGKLHQGVTSFDIGLTILVLSLILGMYLYFSFWI